MGTGQPSPFARFEALCVDLNIDKPTKMQAWDEFARIGQTFTLEGDDLLWLVCGLYFACRRIRQNKKSMGNCVSLTRLLRSAKKRVRFVYPRRRSKQQSEAEKWRHVLIQFFDKIKKWCSMTTLPVQLVWGIEKLERNFNVSTVVFQKMHSMFKSVFVEIAVSEKRDRRNRRSALTTCELYKFCWTLFVLVKGNFGGISDHLVNSFHLFLCCLDWLCCDCVFLKRNDLLNANLPPLQNALEQDSIASDSTCILDFLCENTDGVAMEAKVIRQHYWKPSIRKLVKSKVLRSRPNSTCGFLDSGNFEANVRAVDSAYEEHVMTVGDFDERVFLGGGEREYVASSSKKSDMDEVDGILLKPFGIHDGVCEKRNFSLSFIGSQRLTRLHHLLKGRKTEPSENFLKLLIHIGSDLSDSLESKVAKYCHIFIDNYRAEKTEKGCTKTQALDFRIEYTKTLYYRIVEDIISAECERLASKKEHLVGLLEQDDFLRSIFACALKLVLFAFNDDTTTTDFRWILNAYDLSPFYSYKVIESVVKCEQNLPRDMVQHLNCIEEEIIDTLAWRSDSPLWKLISETTVPTCEQCTFPSHLEKDDENAKSSSPSLNKVVGSVSLETSNPKRRLFTTSLTGPGGSKILTTKQIQVTAPTEPGEQVAKTFTFQTAVGDDGRQFLIPVQLVPVRKPDGPQRRGSMAIFFRKVYHLASVRLRTLCVRLSIDDTLRGRIWTCLEYCIVKNVDLLKDRNLDQIILCSVHIICRVSNDIQTFQEIVDAYKWQPQARSCVYRDVLVRHDDGTLTDKSESSEEGHTNSTGETREIRGDIVQFYNEIFLHESKKFALKLSVKDDVSCPLITSLPLVRGLKVPSRKLSDRHSLYVSPIKDRVAETVCPRLRYRFDEGYSCDLRFINKMIRKMIDPDKETFSKKAKKRPLRDENGNDTTYDADDIHFLKRIRKSSNEEHQASMPDLVSMSALRQKLLGLVRDRQSHSEVVVK